MPELHETKISGVTFNNRQHIIRALKVDDAVILRRNPSNAFDRNAVEVWSLTSGMIGYIPKDLAAQIASRMDELGGNHNGIITAISAIQGKNSMLSVRIRFELPD